LFPQAQKAGRIIARKRGRAAVLLLVCMDANAINRDACDAANSTCLLTYSYVEIAKIRV